MSRPEYKIKILIDTSIHTLYDFHMMLKNPCICCSCSSPQLILEWFPLYPFDLKFGCNDAHKIDAQYVATNYLLCRQALAHMQKLLSIKFKKKKKKKSKHDFLITFWQSDIIVQLLFSPLFHINIINKNTYKPLPRCLSLSLYNCILNGEHIIIHIFPNDIQQLTPILSFKVASIQTYD
jgi:hypothetical protein